MWGCNLHWTEQKDHVCFCRLFCTNHIKLVSLTKDEWRIPPRLVKLPRYTVFLNEQLHQMRADVWYATQWQCEIAGCSVLMCLLAAPLKKVGSHCSDGWLSVLSDYFCCLYFSFEPRKIAAKLLTCSESHCTLTSICLKMPFHKDFTRLHLCVILTVRVGTEDVGLLYFRNPSIITKDSVFFTSIPLPALLLLHAVLPDNQTITVMVHLDHRGP